MTEAPICPVHGLAMRKFEFGWKCTKKLADGWCNQRVKFGTEARTEAPKPTPMVSSLTGELLGRDRTIAMGKQACARASVDFVARIYQGKGHDVASSEMIAYISVIYNGLLPLFEDKE